MKYIMKKEAIIDGFYGGFQTWSDEELPEGYVWVDENFREIFYPKDKKYAGFVNIELDEESKNVINMEWNDDNYNKFYQKAPKFYVDKIPKKINEMSIESNKQIENGIDVVLQEEITTEGQEQEAIIEHFDLTKDDQNNLNSMFIGLFGGMTAYPYHSKEGNCKIYTNEQIAKIYQTETYHITHHQTYFNQLKRYIKSFEGADDSQEVVLDGIYYGQELTGEYLEKYNEMMEEAQKQIITVLSNLSTQMEN